jgi:hypothetical protein
MYVQPNEIDRTIIYQGDLIKEFPFPVIYESSLPVVGNKQDKTEVALRLNMVMVLSQTCDAQRRENIIICPVFPVQEISTKQSEIESVRKRKIQYWFYLPQFGSIIREAIADFQTIHYIPRKTLEGYKSNKILSLSDWGRHHLGWALSSYFGRPIVEK